MLLSGSMQLSSSEKSPSPRQRLSTLSWRLILRSLLSKSCLKICFFRFTSLAEEFLTLSNDVKLTDPVSFVLFAGSEIRWFPSLPLSDISNSVWRRSASDIWERDILFDIGKDLSMHSLHQSKQFNSSTNLSTSSENPSFLNSTSPFKFTTCGVSKVEDSEDSVWHWVSVERDLESEI